MQKYRFGEFELDLDAFELRRHGEPVKIERRPLDLLALLITQSHRLVTRDEIISALWPSNVVIDFDAGVNTLVRKVRSALEDSTETPKFVETVPGRGYRFVAPVTRVEAPVAEAPETAERHSSPRSRIAFAWSVLVAVALAVVIAAPLLRGLDTAPSPVRMAVLPFENLSGESELAYLAAGLAEDTSTSLAQIDPANLRLIGVSAGPLAEVDLPLDEMGQRLGVDYVVASSLRRDGTRIRVTSRLLRATDSEQVWSASIDRELTNVLGLQRELSIAIAEQIRLRLSPDVAAAIDRRQTQSPDAYALYLKGRYEWVQLTPASMRRALEYFEQATRVDPDYALAWAGLAFASITSTRTADTQPAAIAPLAGRALARALQLGPDLAETQYAQGYYSLFLDADAEAAARAARRAIEIDPNNAQAHMLLGVTLPLLDQDPEAQEMMRRARELDPMFALAFANSANVALQAGDPERALEFARQTIAINPEFWLGHYYLGRARERLGDPEGALQAYADAARLSGGHSLTYSARTSLLVRLGRLDEVRALVADVTEQAARQYVPAYTIAAMYAAVGEPDEAFEWLDRAVEARDLALSSLSTDSRLRPLHEDPRFAALIARCGCVEETSPPR